MGGGPQKWGGPVHLHILHIPKATTASAFLRQNMLMFHTELIELL